MIVTPWGGTRQMNGWEAVVQELRAALLPANGVMLNEQQLDALRDVRVALDRLLRDLISIQRRMRSNEEAPILESSS